MSSYDFLRRILVTEFGARPDDITPEATPTSLGLDSLSLTELITELEREFDIAITDRQAAFRTLREAAAIVDSLIENGRP